MVRKKLALVNVAVALAVIASFMALSGGSVAAKAIHSSKKVTVTLDGWASSPQEPADLQKVVNAFEKANPDIHVAYNEVNTNYQTVIQAALVAGKGPDVFYVDASYFRQWAKLGVLANLNSFIKSDPSFAASDFYPGLRKSFEVGKNTYGFPKDYSTLAQFDNVPMMAAAGVKSAPTSWSQFAADACKIRKYEVKLGHKNVYGAGLTNDQARWQPLLQSLGGHVLNGAQNKAEIDNKAGVTAISDWAGLVHKGCAAEPSQVGATWQGQQFGEGDAAMVWEGPWAIPYLQSTYPNIHYKIVPLPVKGNLAFTVAYAMNAKAGNKAAAWKLLSYLTGKTGETKWVRLFQVLPARRSIKPDPGDGVFVKGSTVAEGWLFNPGYFSTDGPYTILNNDLDAVAKGKMTARAAAANVEAALNNWILNG
jgi:multiple sugar transport system substrate-binding protein